MFFGSFQCSELRTYPILGPELCLLLLIQFPGTCGIDVALFICHSRDHVQPTCTVAFHAICEKTQNTFFFLKNYIPIHGTCNDSSHNIFITSQKFTFKEFVHSDLSINFADRRIYSAMKIQRNGGLHIPPPPPPSLTD